MVNLELIIGSFIYYKAQCLFYAQHSNSCCVEMDIRRSYNKIRGVRTNTKVLNRMIFKMKLASMFFEKMWPKSGIKETCWLVKNRSRIPRLKYKYGNDQIRVMRLRSHFQDLLGGRKVNAATSKIKKLWQEWSNRLYYYFQFFYLWNHLLIWHFASGVPNGTKLFFSIKYSIGSLIQILILWILKSLPRFYVIAFFLKNL